MARACLAAVVAAVAFGAVGPAAADQQPFLRSATVVRHHVVLKLAVGDVRPVEFTAAKRRAVDFNGALLKSNVRLRETIQLPASTGTVVRWRSPKALRPGAWFVQVMAVETGGVTDCPPKLPNCNDHWSTVRRVVVPKSS